MTRLEGVNLCVRSLAAVLKYDREIHHEGAPTAGKAKVAKGYYPSDAAIVSRIRKDVGWNGGAMKTLEFQIMDSADDIAYSTYNLEDALKGEILRSLEILFSEDEVSEEVARRTTDELGAVQGLGQLDANQVSQIILSTFHEDFLGLDSKKTTGPQTLGSAH